MESLADLHRKNHKDVEPPKMYYCGMCSNSFNCRRQLKLHKERHNESRGESFSFEIATVLQIFDLFANLMNLFYILSQTFYVTNAEKVRAYFHTCGNK